MRFVWCKMSVGKDGLLMRLWFVVVVCHWRFTTEISDGCLLCGLSISLQR